MKTSFVSTLATSNALRETLARASAELVQRHTEVVTGRHYDIGRSLGARTGDTVSLHRQVESLKTFIDTNNLTAQRMAASQASLSLMADEAQTLMQGLINLGEAGTELARGVAVDTARTAMATFTAAVNTTFNGEYLFGGIETGERPVADYQEAGSPAKAAFDAAFTGHFTFPPTDPHVATITGAQMKDFLDNVLEPYFMGAGWQTDWSNASATELTSRISPSKTTETSVSADDAAVRQFMMASVIMIEFGSIELSTEARAVANAKASETVGKAVSGVNAMQTRLGLAEQRVERATAKIEAQVKIAEVQISNLEGVDPYEASTRINVLLTQVEASYSVTSRLQQLHLMNYL